MLACEIRCCRHRRLPRLFRLSIPTLYRKRTRMATWDFVSTRFGPVTASAGCPSRSLTACRRFPRRPRLARLRVVRGSQCLWHCSVDIRRRTARGCSRSSSPLCCCRLGPRWTSNSPAPPRPTSTPLTVNTSTHLHQTDAPQTTKTDLETKRGTPGPADPEADPAGRRRVREIVAPRPVNRRPVPAAFRTECVCSLSLYSCACGLRGRVLTEATECEITRWERG